VRIAIIDADCSGPTYPRDVVRHLVAGGAVVTPVDVASLALDVTARAPRVLASGVPLEVDVVLTRKVALLDVLIAPAWKHADCPDENADKKCCKNEQFSTRPTRSRYSTFRGEDTQDNEFRMERVRGAPGVVFEEPSSNAAKTVPNGGGLVPGERSGAGGVKFLET